ncbi:solute carrier organic anion transporter family member 2A1-like [Dreissena polymorpha]|uniref:solute carrier organic anion transporter family member 2A1-like n=1 Tax=Dreissena polymorpha TaxID=45954 RepID=UPI002263B843|nr:solute carrier organic anion transporter family member 2A1-like [Dreissena polymorpha]
MSKYDCTVCTCLKFKDKTEWPSENTGSSSTISKLCKYFRERTFCTERRYGECPGSGNGECTVYINAICSVQDVTLEDSSHSLCHSGNASNGDSCGGRGNTLILGLFICAKKVAGVGFIPLLTLGHSYIYDNADPKKTPILIGIIFSGSSIGLACGFFSAGAITQTYFVDFDRQDENDLSPSSLHWVGAWWLDFVPAAVVAVCVSIPLCFYPAQLKDTSEQMKHKTENDHNGSNARHTCQSVVDLFSTGFKLFKNPVFMFVSLGVCAANMLLRGLAPFKYIIPIYNVSLVSTGIYLGITILLGAFGFILSGVYPMAEPGGGRNAEIECHCIHGDRSYGPRVPG